MAETANCPVCGEGGTIDVVFRNTGADGVVPGGSSAVAGEEERLYRCPAGHWWEPGEQETSETR